MGFFEHIIVVKELTTLLDNVIAKSPDRVRNLFSTKEDRIAIREAMKTLEDAIDSTQNHINEFGYVAAPHLVDKWQSSLDKLVEARVGKNLPEYLWHKIDFWKNPESNLRDSDKREHTPSLHLLREKCQELLNILK